MSTIDHATAIKLAQADPIVHERLALRTGGYTAHAWQPQQLGGQWAVAFSRRGQRVLLTVVGKDGTVSRPAGQAMMAMPLERQAAGDFALRSDVLAIGAVLFVLLLAMVRVGRGQRLWAAELSLFAAFIPLLWLATHMPFSVTHLHTSFTLLFAADYVLLAGIAVIAFIAMRRVEPTASLSLRGPRWLSWAGAVAGISAAVLVTVRHAFPVGVGLTSAAGARLMSQGITVYGHLTSIPGASGNGDAYWPLAYLAYIPALLVRDNIVDAAVMTTIALFGLCTAVIARLAWRHSGPRAAAWAVAVWCVWPVNLYALGRSYNDFLVALPLLVALLVWERPFWRGLVIAAAGGVNLLPGVVVVAFARLRGERRSAIMRTAAGTLVVLTLCLVLATSRDPSSWKAFYTATLAFQPRRDDIASLWGLLDAGWMRTVMAAALGLAVCWIMSRWRHGLSAGGAVFGGVALLVLTQLLLRQWWYPYTIWPFALVLATQFTGPRLEIDQESIGGEVPDPMSSTSGHAATSLT